jgi:hypothetical protein
MKILVWICKALIFLALAVLEQPSASAALALGARIPLQAGPFAAIKLVVVEENLGGRLR